MNQSLELCLHKQLIPTKGMNLKFRSTVNFVKNSTTKLQTVFKNFKFSLEIACISFNQKLKAYRSEFRPNEQTSLYPVNFFLRNSYESSNCSTSRNRYSPYRSSPYRSHFFTITRKLSFSTSLL